MTRRARNLQSQKTFANQPRINHKSTYFLETLLERQCRWRVILSHLGDMHRVLVLADAATGLRISEILALRWSDIDGQNSCIRVTRAYVYGRFGPPKSRASKRPVPLHPLLAALLEAWRNETPYARDEDLIFPSFRLKGRKPPRANMLVADHLQPAARKVGITGPVGFHTLRRTLASALVANGSDPKRWYKRLQPKI